MSITSTVKNRLIDGINVAFAAIGDQPPKMKKGDNKAATAWKYFVASHVSALAKAQLDAAKKEAVATGVIFDHEKEPREPGDNGVVYLGEQVLITVTVNRATQNISATKMSAYLANKGVSTELLAEAAEHATTMNRPAHIFKVTLATDPDK